VWHRNSLLTRETIAHVVPLHWRASNEGVRVRAQGVYATEANNSATLGESADAMVQGVQVLLSHTWVEA
jgi:hypothetical protein